MKWLGTISLLFFAVIAISIGYMNYSRMSEKWQNCTADTEGIIVDFDSKISMSSSDKILYPVVRYFVNGKGYQITSGSGTNRQKLKVGDTVAVRYNPDKPKQMLIVGYNTKSTIYLCMAVMAMGVVVPFFSMILILKKQ